MDDPFTFDADSWKITHTIVEIRELMVQHGIDCIPLLGTADARYETLWMLRTIKAAFQKHFIGTP